MTNITLELNQTRPSLTKPIPLRLTTSPTLLTFWLDLMTPRRTMPLLPILILQMLTGGGDQVHDVDTTEVDQLAKEWEDLRRAVAESEQLVAPLRIGFDAVGRSFAQRGRELDQL
uniref:Uncharacterized protein n=1 Tax=Peronospora matthiolae TaxID=2874970 RepID=A0AAV1UJB1_9STRA